MSQGLGTKRQDTEGNCGQEGRKGDNFKIYVWWLCFNAYFIVALSKASRDHLVKAFAEMKTLSQPET